MPKEGLSIYFTMHDGTSPVLASISDKTRVLDKETQQLTQSYEAMRKANENLLKRQTELRKELKQAKEETKEAKKAFDELGDAASQDAYDKAKRHQEELRNQLTRTNKALRENEAVYKQNMATIRKEAVSSGLTEPTKAILGSQAGEMFGNSLGAFANTAMTSGLGMPLASLFSDSIGNAISGSIAGFSVAGPAGAAAGALLGTISGVISGGTNILSEQDDSFKEYYNGLYDTVSAKTDETVESGSTIAGSREQTRKAFIHRFGDEEQADAYLAEVKTMAAGTNYDYDEIVGYSKSLLNSYSPDEVFGVLQSLSDATAGLSLSTGDVDMMITGLSRMRTTGKATQEYLNYFSERGVDVYQALSDATGADKSKIAEKVTKGEISGETAAQAILDYINETFGGLSGDLMGTYDAMSANFEDIMSNLSAAGGEGYNEVRKSGITADTEAYSGELGEAVEEMNRIAGENRAYLENLSGQYQREAREAVLLGEQSELLNSEYQEEVEKLRAEYLTAKAAYEAGDQSAGLELEAIYESTDALATAAYESSEQYQKLKEVELEQLDAIRDNTAGLAAATAAYREAQERSKGLGSKLLDDVYSNLVRTGLVVDKNADSNRHAFGLNRVPYDDYPALLHEGERVLTASEARAEDEKRGLVIQVSVTGNSFTAAGEELADQVAEVIVRKIEEAAAIAVPR